MARKDKKSGEELFDEFYSALYGERWDELKASLISEKADGMSIPGLASPYYIDEASFLAASLLPAKPGDSVLDLCAAPGGKTLVIAKKMRGQGSLTANDISSERRRRLRSSIDQCLSEEERAIVRITARNAEEWGVREKDAYDAVLLDAPCSSERHVLSSPSRLALWSPSRPRRLKTEQYAMLSSAFLALKSEGFILYSTCSINPEENEGVVEKLFKRRENEVREIEIDLPHSEKRERGRIILPDAANGLGPIYACLIKKEDSRDE